MSDFAVAKQRVFVEYDLFLHSGRERGKCVRVNASDPIRANVEHFERGQALEGVGGDEGESVVLQIQKAQVGRENKLWRVERFDQIVAQVQLGQLAQSEKDRRVENKEPDAQHIRANINELPRHAAFIELNIIVIN